MRGRSWRSFGIGMLVAAGCLGAPSPSQAVSVETFVLAIGGQAQLGPQFQCATSGPATAALSFFGNVAPSVPAEGLAYCGVGGDYRTTTIPSAGFLSDALDLSTTFNAGADSVTARALASSHVGSARASATSSFSGTPNPSLYRGAASYALSVDRLTATSPSVPAGTAGLIRLTFTVRGGLSVVGVPPANSLADVEINYSVAGGPSFILMRSQANDSVNIPFSVTGTGDPLVGFAASPGAFGGEGEVRGLLVPFTWGQPFDLKFGLIASTIPGQSATSTVDFTGGATLSGLQLQANGQSVNDFTITSESGTPYGPAGVPEPASGATALVGAASLTALFRRHRRAVTR